MLTSFVYLVIVEMHNMPRNFAMLCEVFLSGFFQNVSCPLVVFLSQDLTNNAKWQHSQPFLDSHFVSRHFSSHSSLTKGVQVFLLEFPLTKQVF